MTVGLPRVLRVVPWLLLPAAAMAQQAPPGADGAPDASAAPDTASTKASAPAENPADEEARDLYRRGDRAYAEGAYEAALRDFSEAYRLSGRSALLFNMANAHERLGQFQEALSALERYLPDAGSREALVRKRIKGLQARIQKIEQKRREEERRRQEESAAAATPRDDPVSRPWLGYGLLGVGAVGVGLGTYFALSASSARQDADELCAGDPPVCPRDAEDAVSRDDRHSVFADVGWGVGLTAAAIGVYLILTHDPKPERAVSSPVAVVPGGKQGTRIVFSGAF